MSLASSDIIYVSATHGRASTQLFTTYLFKLKLCASKSTTDVQDVHVEAQIHLNRKQTHTDLSTDK